MKKTWEMGRVTGLTRLTPQ